MVPRESILDFADEVNRYMNAEKYNLDRIYFGGCFIRGELQRYGVRGRDVDD